MVSFRYHVVTIVAVFVALAVGILMGTTVLDQGLVSDLQRRTTDLSDKVTQLQQQVQDQGELVTILQNFDQATRSALVDGRLAGSRVVLVTEEGVNLQDLNGVRQTLSGSGGAGATIDGILELSSKLDMQDEQVRTDVAAMLGVSASESPQRLSDALARALAQRLASGPPTEAGAADLLQELVQAGLVRLSDAREGPSAVGGAGAAVTILSGTAETPVLGPEDFYVPFIQQLVSTGTDTAAVQPSTTGSPFLDVVRGDDQIDGRIVTVDNIEMVPGQVALVWGLEALAAGKGGGDYGVDCGSCSLAPAPQATP
jgi:Holliday junction resolvasome RuvABC endonuclease subunit